MASVLMMNLAPEKRKLIKVLSVRLNFTCSDVPPQQQSCLISELLSGTAQDRSGGKAFRDEMMIMDGFTHPDLNFLLNEMIRTGNIVSLKAVTTPINIRWSAAMLHAQLVAESREIHRKPEVSV